MLHCNDSGGGTNKAAVVMGRNDMVYDAKQTVSYPASSHGSCEANASRAINENIMAEEIFH